MMPISTRIGHADDIDMPTRSHGRWTKDEISVLTRIVGNEEPGKFRWSMVAKWLSGMSVVMCQAKWREIFSNEKKDASGLNKKTSFCGNG